MKINYDCEQANNLFDHEIKLAIDWLLKIRDENSKGWAWVQFIAPNEQNTAEVISALLENSSFLNDETYNLLVESTQVWLIDPQRNAKISLDWAWVLLALQKIKDNPQIIKHLQKEKVHASIKTCVDWLLNNQNADGGWADIKNDLSSTTRTSLSLIALYKEYFNDINNKRLKKAIATATKWLLSNQNSDGGWGNLNDEDIDRRYQDLINLPYADLRCQCDSNPACTGYVLLALNEDISAQNSLAKSKAFKYIRDSQRSYGGWDIFSEVGIRSGIKYTFRHFSTTWALRALLCTQNADYTDDCIITGINYLIQLQDDFYGGWKSSLDADNYTWATCNALETIHLVKKQLSDVKAKQFLQIVCDWWNLKKKNCNFSIKIRNTIFAFNTATCLLFCITFTIMMFLILSAVSNLPALIVTTDNTKKIIHGIVIIIGSFIFGLPWVVFVKNVFNKDMDSWINSFGWVYGIITGFLLAYYQLIL